MKNLKRAASIRRPLIVGIGGFTSEVGKTTLLCDLLQAFPSWEAIKTTRGHYRSCGKDPHACCVSDLLEDKAVVRSGRDLTYTPGKDTGRYWDAGASNVHWVIATDAQVEAGVKEALNRVRTEGVFVEGNSFTQTIEPDLFVMVARPDRRLIKATARKALRVVTAVYVSGESCAASENELKDFLVTLNDINPATQVFSSRNFSALVNEINQRLQSTEQTQLHNGAS